MNSISVVRARRKQAEPTEQERASRPVYTRRRREPSVPRPGLRHLELGRRSGLSLNTIVDIEKRRLLVTDAITALLVSACEQAQIDHPTFPNDLKALRDAAGLTQRDVLAFVPTPDGQSLHRDTMTDVERGHVEITEEMYRLFVSAIEQARSGKEGRA